MIGCNNRFQVSFLANLNIVQRGIFVSLTLYAKTRRAFSIVNGLHDGILCEVRIKILDEINNTQVVYNIENRNQ